jgi:dCTP deaminase
MILSDRDLKKVIRLGHLKFHPKLSPDQIGPASIDLKLGPTFKVFKTRRNTLLDLKNGLPEDFTESYTMRKGEPFILHPHGFVLTATREYLSVPADLVVRVEGKSTLARMGILVHTAGFVDPGFEGTITLEVSNQGNLAVALYPSMYICQIAVHTMTTPADIPYNLRKKSLYSRQRKPVEGDPRNLFEHG